MEREGERREKKAVTVNSKEEGRMRCRRVRIDGNVRRERKGKKMTRRTEAERTEEKWCNGGEGRKKRQRG